MNHSFSHLGLFLSLFFSLYLFVCPILRDWKNTEKSEKESKMEKRKNWEMPFTNLCDNDMAARHGFYSHVDYRKYPSVSFRFRKCPWKIITNYQLSTLVNNVLSETNLSPFLFLDKCVFPLNFQLNLVLISVFLNCKC